MIELLNIDCMKYMKTLKDKAFDLAIVDPPYGISQPPFRKESNNKAARPKEYNNAVYNQDAPSWGYFMYLEKVSKNQIVWGGNYFNKYLEIGNKWIFWDKRTEETQWGDGELAWTSFKGAVTKFDFAWNGMIQGDMKNKETRIHPTQKPVALYRWLLHNYAKPGDKILDTHGGSRSLAIACHDMGFDHVSCEIDLDYHNDSVKRYKQHTMQQKLFL